MSRTSEYSNQRPPLSDTTSSIHTRDDNVIHRVLSEVGLNPKDFIYGETGENGSQSQQSYQPSNNGSSSVGKSYPSHNYQSPQQSQPPREDSEQRLSGRNELNSAFKELPHTSSKSSTRGDSNYPNNSQFAANTITSFGRQPSYGQQPPPPPAQNQQQFPSTQNPNRGPAPTFSSNFDQQRSQPPPASSQAGFDQRPNSNQQQPLPNVTQPTSFNLANRLSPKLFTKQNQTIIDNPQSMDTTSADRYMRQIDSHENPPIRVVKPNAQNVVYRKEIRIRYLQPPTPPPPAPIIIREKQAPAHPPQSPLLIRERKAEAHTPPPLTIRERPPTPPPPLEPHIIEKTLPPGPVQPRQIIIERLPTPPPKPRTVIFEKWLPYKKVKRPVLLQKAQPPAPVKPVRNVIIEYEPLKAFTVRRVIEEGVFRVDPHTYITQQPQSGIGDVRIVERIEDLPPPSEQLMRVLDDYNHDHSSQRNYHNNTTTHSPIPHSYNQFHEQEVKPQGLSSTLANLFGGRSNPVQPNTSQGPLGSNLADVSRASNIPANRQERVLSGYNSSIPSPTVIPLGKKSYHREHSNSGDSSTEERVY